MKVYELNLNMRCIEIDTSAGDAGTAQGLNLNMRCIEI